MTQRLTAELLDAVTDCGPERAKEWLGPIQRCMDCFDISTPARQAMFLAQVGHESGGLRIAVENMNYSAERLIEIWPKRFTAEVAKTYARKPEAIANKVYASRMGNGDEMSGDGFKYRGRGLMQMTGKDDYKDASHAIGADLVKYPELVEKADIAAMCAGWEWDRSQLNIFADTGDIDGCSDVINIGHRTKKEGDSHGFADRRARWEKAKQVLGVA